MIGIIDYGVGNLASIINALGRINAQSFISTNPDQLVEASALILPGDGAAASGMENLKKLGLDRMIVAEIKKKKPFLGICLGMQVLLSYSEEGGAECLNVIPGQVRKVKTNLKIPEIGWNQVRVKNSKMLLKGLKDNSFFYFINSYVCVPEDKSVVSGVTTYGETFCSAFEKKNIFGVQFHPEKSGEVGLQLLKNFLEVVC